MNAKLKSKYVPLDIALKLKEKGYPQRIDEDDEDYDFLAATTMVRFTDEPDNLMSYDGADIQGYLEDWYQERHSFQTVVAPSYYQAMIWLIENFNIHCAPTIEVEPDSYGNVKGYHYDYDVVKLDIEKEESSTSYNEGLGTTYGNGLSYEDALAAGVKFAIEKYL